MKLQRVNAAAGPSGRSGRRAGRQRREFLARMNRRVMAVWSVKPSAWRSSGQRSSAMSPAQPRRKQTGMRRRAQRHVVEL